MGEAMKTHEMQNDAGVSTGFRVGSSMISRSGIVKTIQSIPGVEILWRNRPLHRFSERDDFCGFVVDGVRFLAIEPHGYSDEYWIVQEEPQNDCPPLGKIQAAFAARRTRFGLNSRTN
jgi:hypothetical protein